MTLRYGIIGTGMMGQEHIRNVQLLGDAEVVAIADPDRTMLGSAQQLAGEGVRTYFTHTEMIAAGGLDALIVVAPNHLHHAIMRDCMETDLPILCEKPLGISVAECEDMARWAEDRAAPVWVAMEYRYMPPVARLIEEVADGRAGDLRMLSIREHRFPFLDKVNHWNRFNAQTGGTLVEKCCHFFDLMRLILQAEPVRVFASGSGGVNHAGESVDGRVPDILDHAFVIVEFDNGSRAMLDLCMFAEGSYWQEVISATGDKARIDAMIPGPARFAPGGSERASRLVISNRGTRMEEVHDIHVDQAVLAAGDHHGSTFFQHERFARMIREGGAPDVTVADGLIAVAVGAAAEQSVRTGLPVDLRPFHERSFA
ncbi:Gfo/Idh/MocA family oxidoreductase [Roseobacter sp. HKCCA0434]|uniref:Gfo/Idh/MocA family protein n=1 Tax=Roseobacter sp. HKCCA0434 TaxID=3079297 RepID=UPI0029058293|nr:Gfo/Idh/MocA family oxidoreductase [Roseobacter sp. HKCCA0434]